MEVAGSESTPPDVPEPDQQFTGSTFWLLTKIYGMTRCFVYFYSSQQLTEVGDIAPLG